MNPEKQVPSGISSPENQPTGPEIGGGEFLPSPEVGERGSHEQEKKPQRGDLQPAPPPVNVTLPLPTISVPATKASDDDSTSPTIAADDDVIEKEWVDKAKKIIAETQNDPYRREKEVSKLQADYLRKRYGKELGVSN